MYTFYNILSYSTFNHITTFFFIHVSSAVCRNMCKFSYLAWILYDFEQQKPDSFFKFLLYLMSNNDEIMKVLLLLWNNLSPSFLLMQSTINQEINRDWIYSIQEVLIKIRQKVNQIIICCEKHFNHLGICKLVTILLFSQFGY